MPHIEINFNRFLHRMEAVQTFVSLRSYDAAVAVECLSPSLKKVVALDFNLNQAALSGPGWYDSSWDLIQGLVVLETTAAGSGRLDDWSQCLLA